MSRMIVNPKWQKEVRERIAKFEPIDETTSFNKSIQWLIVVLSNAGVKYRLFDLGAGVKRLVTTNIDTCPCCKRKLGKEDIN